MDKLSILIQLLIFIIIPVSYFLLKIGIKSIIEGSIKSEFELQTQRVIKEMEKKLHERIALKNMLIEINGCLNDLNNYFQENHTNNNIQKKINQLYNIMLEKKSNFDAANAGLLNIDEINHLFIFETGLAYIVHYKLNRSVNNDLIYKFNKLIQQL